MDRELYFYDKESYFTFKKEKESIGSTLVSITDFIYKTSLIADISCNTIVDISSLNEFTNKQSIAEQVLPQFDGLIEFVCEISKWKSMKYDLRYVFDITELEEEEEIRHYKNVNANLSLTEGDLDNIKIGKKLLMYEKDEFNHFEKVYHDKGYIFYSITPFITEQLDINKLNTSNIIVDISAISEYSKTQSIAEEVLLKFKDDLLFICDYSIIESLEFKLRFIFKEFEKININKLFEPENSENLIKHVPVEHHRKIINLNDKELEDFFENFRKKLYGHPKFKDDFEEQVKTFRVFNKLKEHKILSLFLLGESGVGKTEVARLIFDCLHGTKRFAKINFGNYSNEFSLSSLIGSARGYIGSDDGEIFMKVRDTDIGILLIDEFEKSNATLFNYFLEVLESGKMTNSLGAEIDLNGFIIVFTSNITKEDFKNKISPELRSRFDYKCRFTLLSNEDKLKYLEFRSKTLINKINQSSEIFLSEGLFEYLKANIDVSKYKNMRDINKEIKKHFVSFVNESLCNIN